MVEHPGVGRRVGSRRPPDRRLVDVDDLVDLVRPGDRAVPAGHVAGVVDPLGQRGVEDGVDQRRLARSGHPGHRDQLAERERHRDVAQVVLDRVVHGDHPALGPRPPRRRQRDRASAGQVRAGERVRVGQQPLDRAGVHHVPAVLPRAGADVHGPVGGTDGVLVVLDHDQRVAQVAQPDQGLDQPAVVPLVQPDARLVQHVEHPDQPGADLGGQPDPLRLAAGQAGGGSAERQVVQADVEQELEPLVDLLEHPLGDLPLPLAQLAAGAGSPPPRRSTSRRSRRCSGRRP